MSQTREVVIRNATKGEDGRTVLMPGERHELSRGFAVWLIQRGRAFPAPAAVVPEPEGCGTPLPETEQEEDGQDVKPFTRRGRRPARK